MKKRVLLVNEASFLKTGFSKIGHEILTRLHDTGKYELAELGSYAEATDPRALVLPWKFYSAIPHKDDQFHQKRYQTSIFAQFGEAMFETVALEFRPDVVIDIRDNWMCFPKGTNLHLESGDVINIEDAKVGDFVLTHNSRGKKIVKIGNRIHDGQFVKIRTSVLNVDTILTDDHPVMISKDWMFHHSKNKDVVKFVPAKDLKPKDCVFFSIPEFKDKRSELTNAQLEALGFFVAEGCYLKHNGNKDGVQICGSGKERDVVTKHINSLATIVGGTIHRCSDKQANRTTRRIQSKELANLLFGWFGEYAAGKFLPKWIHELPKDQLCWFLKGLINGDGCSNPITKRARYYTVSKKLALQTWKLFLKLGIECGFSNATTKLKGHTFHRHIISAFEADFNKWHEIYTSGEMTNLNKSKNFYKNYYKMCVTKVEKYTDKKTVYNIEVEDDHTYVTNFVVHNCTEWQAKTVFRPLFKYVVMPTIDGEPQRWDWLLDYSNPDVLLTYSDYGKRTLNREAPNLHVTEVVRPGVNHDIFKPVEDKAALRESFGIDPNCNVILTVMRNQRRKLFPDLIEAFADFIKLCVARGNVNLAKNTYLYLHTSYPDVGFDIPKHIMNSGMGNRILMTYVCGACGAYYPLTFQGEVIRCPKCNNPAAHLANTSHGVTEEQLANIYNLADIYVQPAISEGYSCPLAEAKSCGIPILATNYSAMEDHVATPGGFPIEVEKRFWEPVIETEQSRALPSKTHLVKQLYDLLPKKDFLRQSGLQGREHVAKNESFDRAAKIFESVIDSLDVPDHSLTWLNTNYNAAPLNNKPPQGMSNAEFVDWCIDNVINRPYWKGLFIREEFVKALSTGSWMQRGRGTQFNHQKCFEYFVNKGQEINFWEQQRLTKCLPKLPTRLTWEVV